MDRIETRWEIGLSFNEVHFIGTVEDVKGPFQDVAVRLLLDKAMDFIDKAQQYAECMPVSKKPQGFMKNTEDYVSVSFVLMFKEAMKAQMFIQDLKRIS